MGETDDEVVATLADLAGVGVDIVTIGQYLRPTTHHLPVARWCRAGQAFEPTGRPARPSASATSRPARSPARATTPARPPAPAPPPWPLATTAPDTESAQSRRHLRPVRARWARSSTALDDNLTARRRQPCSSWPRRRWATDGHVNLSPKGGTDMLRGSSVRRLGRLPRPHRQRRGDDRPPPRERPHHGHVLRLRGTAQILRLYGAGRAWCCPDDERVRRRCAHRFPADVPGARAVVVVEPSSASTTSCGYAVPFLAYEGDRETMLHRVGRAQRAPPASMAYHEPRRTPRASTVCGLPSPARPAGASARAPVPLPDCRDARRTCRPGAGRHGRGPASTSCCCRSGPDLP